jgi:hypothetical protein
MEDRDRTVSRMLIPALLRAQTIPSPFFKGLACYGVLQVSGYQARLAISSLKESEEVVTGAHSPLLRRCSSTSAAKYRFFLE